MRATIENIVIEAIEAAMQAGELKVDNRPEPAVERPRDPGHGDWATTVALRLAKEVKCAPREIAELVAAHIRVSDDIASVEIAGPGFINLRLSASALQRVIRAAREQGGDFARPSASAPPGVVAVDQSPKTVNIEFISANPTGPMHVGHGRWAALGNALCNIYEHAGWQVTREFYINDAGHQMDVFGNSVVYRYLEALGQAPDIPEEFYGGAYVTDIARAILEQDGETWLNADEAKRLDHFREQGYAMMLAQMQDLCTRIDVPFDTWYSERSLYEKDTATGFSAVESMLARLEAAGYLYEKDDATWFKTTDLGDDKDRVLIKADGSYTYFAPDIAYHLSKFERGSEHLVNIWGADHHGYIPRMQAACTALGHGGKLDVVLGQLVNLFRAGEVVRMSKRTGEMVTFGELVDEVGADATKYLMLSRSTEQPIDFDIEAAKKQDASNPVYYVQYAHARICSILRKASEEGIDTSQLDKTDLIVLVDEGELELAREFSRLSEVIEGAVRDRAPFRLTHYAEALATCFHSFYTRCKVIGEDDALTQARLYLCDATRSVLALVLSLLGVSAPERM